MTRRTVLVAGMTANWLAARTGAVRLGGPIFSKSDDPEELAREHRRLGYGAGYCPRLDLKDKEKIRATSQAFAKHNVTIAEVGAWCNLLHPDAATRKRNVDHAVSQLALADAVGATCCVAYTGSANLKVHYGAHPDALSRKSFDAVVATWREIIDAVKPTRAKMTVEMMGWLVPNSPDMYLRLFKAIDRPQLAVHMDVCNGINSPEKLYDNAAFTRECFSKLGRWIVSCHAKDLEFVPAFNVHFREVVPGRGMLDYVTYLREAARAPLAPPLLLEHLANSQEYDEGRAYIRRTGEQNGIQFV